MCKLPVITFLTLNLIILSLQMSAQYQVLADSAAVSDTAATKEFSGLPDGCSPTQVHIAIGDSSTEMKITWSTPIKTGSLVRYGFIRDTLDLKAIGSFKNLVGLGVVPSIHYIHSVTLKGLKPGTKYYYSVGSYGCESRTFDFVSMPTGSEWSPSLIFYGDMGTKNAVILPWLEKEIKEKDVNAIIHAGDYAYDLNHNCSQTGNQFMAQIESVAAHVPYMGCPGNHEIAGDFYEFKTRFNMPSHEKTQSMYYSWDMGPVHFISICTEYYFLPYPQLLPELLAAQYFWLLNDLQDANKNRDVRPWIIVYGHTPLYCSNDNNDACVNADNPVRIGVQSFGTLKFGLEELFREHKVDLYLSGHEHSYERLLPIYNGNVMIGNAGEPYLNPQAPVQLIAGNAGNKEGVDHFPLAPTQPPLWSAFRSEDYGYVRMKISNRTHLSMDYVSASQDGNVIDSITIIKDSSLS